MTASRLSLNPSEHRFAGIVATVLAHAALIAAWQAVRHVPLSDRGGPTSVIQLLLLPERVPPSPALDKAAREALRTPVGHGAAAPSPTPTHTPPGRTAPGSERIGEPAVTVLPAPEANGVDSTPPASSAPLSVPSDRADQILERARRDAGTVERALRKENNPYIVAPLDSPMIRMRSKIDQAAALAPNRLWEAPKMEELVNDTGDGARRTRVITAGGVYCVTERSSATSIDMIEKHGKLRITNCGLGHEQPANAQKWRTARD